MSALEERMDSLKVADCITEKIETIRTETMEEMESRHKKETRELDGEIRAMLKKAKKAEKAETEAKAIQMQFDLKARHREEIDEFEEQHPEESSESCIPVKSEEISKQAQLSQQEEIQAKKAKAKKKQDKKKAKEAEKEDARMRIQAEAGPSLREIELEKINKQLLAENLCIKPISSDGHCLYRSVADQLKTDELKNISSESVSVDSSSNVKDFKQLRKLAAQFLRSHVEECAPFLGLLSATDQTSDDWREYENYCCKVESESLAEWGGQLEIKALCNALSRTILVYSADSPVLCMQGDTDSGEKPLRLSFHRHYYALGEHYNSVISTALA